MTQSLTLEEIISIWNVHERLSPFPAHWWVKSMDSIFFWHMIATLVGIIDDTT